MLYSAQELAPPWKFIDAPLGRRSSRLRTTVLNMMLTLWRLFVLR